MFGEGLFDDLVEEEASPKARARPKSPPKTSEEWLESQGLADWPSPLPDEMSLYARLADTETGPEGAEVAEIGRGCKSVLGSLDDIKADLMKHSPWDSGFLESVDSRLQQLERMLAQYGNRFICDPSPTAQESVAGGLVNIKDKTFLTDLCDMDLLSTRPLHVASKSTRKPEVSGKSADAAVFPGFIDESDAVPLPGSLEALPLLDTVTKTQCITAHLLKAWRKIFYSDASCSLFQNTFWWIWMEWFQPHAKHQARLFSNIAENFVALIHAINTKNMDKAFLHYPDCLAQALYTAFCRAFPKTNKVFNSEPFLSFLCDLTSEWTSGVRSPPRRWEKWKRHLLNPHHVVEEHEGDTTNSKQAFTEKDVLQFSRQAHSRLQSTRFRLPSGRRKSASLARQTSTFSRATTIEKSVLEQEEALSMGVAPGPAYECVMFGIHGSSPLLQHYFVTHQLREEAGFTGPRVTRTQVKDSIVSSISYKQLLEESASQSEETYQNYERYMAESNQEAAAVHRRHIAELRHLEKKNKRLLQHRHEVSILAERLMENRKKGLPPIKNKPVSKT